MMVPRAHPVNSNDDNVAMRIYLNAFLWRVETLSITFSSQGLSGLSVFFRFRIPLMEFIICLFASPL